MADPTESPILSRLIQAATNAYKVDSRYAEQVLLAAKTAQLKRDTWAGRKEKKTIEKPVNLELAALLGDLDTAV